MGKPTRRRGGARTAILLALPLLVGLAADAAAHEVLKRSVPANGARLDAAPRELRLTFGRAVEPALTRVELIGPTGAAVELTAPVRAADSANVVTVAVVGPLMAGDYTVRWRVVGADGHPVQGQFHFAISEGAAGLAPPPGPASDAGAAPGVGAAEPAGGGAPAAAADHGGALPAGAPAGVAAPAYVAIRWFTFLCVIGVIGCVAFRWVVLGAIERRGGELADAVVAHAAERARVIGSAAAWMLLPAAALRLLAQLRALGAVQPGLLRELLAGTAWGAGWLLQVAAAVAAIAALWAARRGGRAAWGAAAVAAVALAVTPALSGHAVATPQGPALAVAADSFHVLGAGGWLGTLALLLAAGVPAALRLEAPRRGAAVAALVGAFSPAALCFAAIVVATGVYAAVMHVGRLDALVASAYGKTLLVKLGAIAVVLGFGAYNFLRVRPSLGDDAGIPRLRRSSAAELAVGLVVLAATALLVATPPAAEVPAAAADAVEAQPTSRPPAS
ncbi:MAG TPA: copper resistance protein CopC [Longimicrobiales bacterium]